MLMVATILPANPEEFVSPALSFCDADNRYGLFITGLAPGVRWIACLTRDSGGIPDSGSNILWYNFVIPLIQLGI